MASLTRTKEREKEKMFDGCPDLTAITKDTSNAVVLHW
jgi:hypothetical protein